MKKQSVNAWFSQRVVSVVPYPRKCKHLIIQVQSILSLFDVIYLMDLHLLEVYHVIHSLYRGMKRRDHLKQIFFQANSFIIDPNEAPSKEVKPIGNLHKILKFRLLHEGDVQDDAAS